MAPAPLPPKQVALRWRRCAWIIYVMMITVIIARSIYAFVVVCVTADTPPTSQQTMLNGFDSWPEFHFEPWFYWNAKPVFYWTREKKTNVSIRNSQVVFRFPPGRVAAVTDPHPLLVAYSVSSQNMTMPNLPVVAMNYFTTDGPVPNINVAMLPVSCGARAWKTRPPCKTIDAVFMKIRKNQMVDSDLYWKHAFQSHSLTFESVAHPVDEYHAIGAVNAPVLMGLVDNMKAELKDFNQRLFNLSDASARKEDLAYVMIYVQADSMDAIRVSTHSFVSRSITIFGCAGGYGSLVSVMFFLLFRVKKERELPDEDLLIPLFASESSGTDSDSETPSVRAVVT